MKKIFKVIVLSALSVVLGTSCSDWLDVSPSDQIKEEYLFATGNGYRTALNGIYRNMTSFSTYGSNLKWGLVDAWGQVYDAKDKAPVSNGGQAIMKIEKLDYKNYELTPTTDKMWSDLWNLVANCNELAQQAEKADSMLFHDREKERQMILGEAIGLRAYIQFDLLRIYAPSLAMNPGERTFIPYIDVYPSYLSDRQTVSYCLDKIIRDLKRAQELLWPIDGDMSWVGNRFKEEKNDEKRFKRSRGYRLNYCAITAALARVYLYAGMQDKAYEQAKKMIELSNYFTALTGRNGEQAIKNGDLKMSDDIFFALYSPKDQIEWERLINHSSDKSDKPDEERFLGLSKDMAEELYGDELKKDWRAVYQLEQRGAYYRTMKYCQQPESYTNGKMNNQIVPMFRMSEIYYIAAEAIYKTNLDEAKGYLTKVKQGRGLTPDLSTVNEANFLDVLVNDARREFIGEGQTFFMYKRMLRPMIGAKEVIANEENTVLPLPDSESSI